MPALENPRGRARTPAVRGRVLVLGGDSRSCLTVVRSLGRKGLQVDLGLQDEDSIVPYSRYVSSVVRFPSSGTDLDAWAACLRERLEQRAYDLVIPTSDDALVPIALRRTELTALARFAIPDEAGFLSTYRKRETFALARRLNVPCPETTLIEDLGALEASARKPPLIVKPDSSKVWTGGLKRDLKVRLVRSDAELRRVVEDLLTVTPVLLQDHFPGVGVGQEFLAHNGDILTAFQHQRVHEAGGGSSYRKSVPLDGRMLACSTRMLAHLRWTGVAMVEYRWNAATGEFVLVEINGRFWGSLPLAVAAGVDFPSDLYALLVEGRRPERRPYRVGVYSRNLVKDLDWYRVTRRADSSNSYVVKVPLSQVLAEFSHVLRGAEHWDTVTTDDPVPGLAEIALLFWAQARKIPRVVRGAVRQLAAVLRWRHRAERARLRDLLQTRPHVLFVCKGNVCRSPFAEFYARAAAARRDLHLTVGSAGTLPAEGRPAPETAQTAGLERGVDLGPHRSKVLTRERAQSAGALVCMDWQTRERVLKSFPETAGRLFLLKPFARHLRGAEIADPWGRPLGVFRACYEEVAGSVDGLLETVEEGT
jgi:protein-tyrosine-phosphatase/predicted ATP-grasp superfamily ATP-dependent carboligase